MALDDAAIDAQQKLTCQYCEGVWFERRVLCRYQINNPFVYTKDFVPLEQIQVARCATCGTCYDSEGKIITTMGHLVHDENSIKLKKEE